MSRTTASASASCDITINDLADNKLINAKTFALICNAMAIRKYGLGAIQFTDEPKT